MQRGRRRFLSGVMTAGLAAALSRGAHAQARSDYGELRPTRDRDGRLILALPEGFEYCCFSRTGERFGEGQLVARSHDGMACFTAPGGRVRLIRNHELAGNPGQFAGGLNGPAHLRYDVKAPAGCMTLDFDTRRKVLVRQFIAIGGTYVNCSGGLAYRDSGWITCEESTAGPLQGMDKPHGYAFLVPAAAQSTIPAVPLTAMGRFRHEAAVADSRGVVYQTEDSGGDSGFYRFLPQDPSDLQRGGRLQMLAVKGAPAAALHTGQVAGRRLAVAWVDIADPDPGLEQGARPCFEQGRSAGGASFARLEGLYRGGDGRSMYFVSTNGGAWGQLWHYHAGREELELVFQSSAGHMLESPDNLCLTPGGGVLFCEDDGVRDADTHPAARGLTEVNRLVGLGRSGQAFPFAVNLLNASEFAGACFSPDGALLFVNIYGDGSPGSGMTCAIWGPWSRGPL